MSSLFSLGAGRAFSVRLCPPPRAVCRPCERASLVSKAPPTSTVYWARPVTRCVNLHADLQLRHPGDFFAGDPDRSTAPPPACRKMDEPVARLGEETRGALLAAAHRPRAPGPTQILSEASQAENDCLCFFRSQRLPRRSGQDLPA